MYAPALKALTKSNGVKVVGLVDPSEAQRAKMSSAFPNAIPYPSLASCALGPHNLVIIATPPKFHAEQSLHALRLGAAVLCEKPIAVSSRDAASMIDAARDAGAILAVGIFRRFFPAFEALKNVFEQEPFGKLQTFSIQEGGKFGWGATSDSFFRRDQTLGGVFFDVGVYVVDALFWWLGEPATFRYQDDAMGGVEANCLLDLSYARGFSGTVRLSREWPTQNRYIFTFEKGTVIYEVGQANHLSISIDGIPFLFGGEVKSTDSSYSNVSKYLPTRTIGQSFTEQLLNVVNAIRGQQSLRVSGQDALRSLTFIENCYRNRTLMDMPWLDGKERNAAQELARATR